MTPLFALLMISSSTDYQSYRAHIAAASDAYVRGDISATLAWLNLAPKDHLGWEWDYLSNNCDQSTAKLNISDQPLTRMQISPDGSMLAVACTNHKIYLVDTRGFRVLRTLEGHTNAVYGIGFSSDGKQLVSTSMDKTIRLWDVHAGVEQGVLGEHPVTPYSAAFSPDGKTVVSVGWRMHPEKGMPVGLIRVWDVVNRKMLNDQDYTTHPISCVVFAPDGSRCYIGCWEYQIAELDLATFKIVREITPPKSMGYHAIDWLALSENRLVSATKDKSAKVFDLTTAELQHSLPHFGNVTSVHFTQGALLTSSQDGTLRLFDADSGAMQQRFVGHQVPITGAASMPDGSMAFSCDGKGRLFKWDLTKPTAYADQGAWSGVFSPDGVWIASGTNDRCIRIRDAKTLKVVKEIAGFESLVVDVAWSPDSGAVAAGSNDGTFRVFDVATGAQKWLFKGKGQFRSAAFSKDGRWVASGSGTTGDGLVLDAKTGEVKLTEKLTPGTVNSCFSPSSQQVAFAAGLELRVQKILNPASKPLSIKLSSAALDVDWSADGKHIVVGEQSGEVEVFDIKGKRVWLAKTLGSQWGVAFSPDGKRIASTGYDFQVHLWDRVTGQEMFALRDLPTQGFDVHFSPDGNQLLYMVGEGQAWILDRRPPHH